MVASKLGTPLAFDSYMEDLCLVHKGRKFYARILIEISVDNKWKDSVEVDTWDFFTNSPTHLSLPVEYSWKPASCPHCPVFGHDEKVCVAAISTNNAKVVENRLDLKNVEMPKDDQSTPEESFTVVTRKTKKNQTLLLNV
ncbi:hypothetical protein L2E82_08288 [Cichorium intybus]|uniref:Uncharacterized protein n=1 Tax=Cichorium intybus TaxID=13427 RepID=A0ACB9G5H5_CICIN|nr:hypothetical protein L2E82_08288 [Cichorium intybus]